MKSKKILLIVLACVAVPTVIMGIVLGVKTLSKDKEPDSTVSIKGEEESGEPTSTADTATSTDGSAASTKSSETKTNDKDTKETKDKAAEETYKDGNKTKESTGSTTSGSGSATETTKSSGTTPTKPVVPPETEEGELIIIEPDQPKPTPTTKPSGGKKPTGTPSGGNGGNGGSGTTETSKTPTKVPSTPTEETEMGPIELPFVPAEDL